MKSTLNLYWKKGKDVDFKESFFYAMITTSGKLMIKDVYFYEVSGDFIYSYDELKEFKGGYLLGPKKGTTKRSYKTFKGLITEIYAEVYNNILKPKQP
tara:strand:- start:220 stop:513 length:294 start_codon:yes stop_codon:yes gene_type:complete